MVVWPIVNILPSRCAHLFLGHPFKNKQLCLITTESQFSEARQIAALMELVAGSVPWRCECLAQAICVNWLFKRRKIPSITYLGAAFEKDAEGGMQAHAWICVGPSVVLGHHANRFSPIATFTSTDLSDYE